MSEKSVYKKPRKSSKKIGIIILVTIIFITLLLIIFIPRKPVQQIEDIETSDTPQDSVKTEGNIEARMDSALYSFVNIFGGTRSNIRFDKKTKIDGLTDINKKRATIRIPDVFPMPVLNEFIQKKITNAGGTISDVIETGTNELNLFVAYKGFSIRDIIIRKDSKLLPQPIEMAFVIDDFGLFDSSFVNEFFDIQYPLNYAIIPFRTTTDKWINIAKVKNLSCVIHMPMEPLDYPKNDPGANAIFKNLPPQEVKKRIDNALLSIPEAFALSNHMGSKITEDKIIMSNIIKQIKNNNKLFLDCRTTTKSVCKAVCDSLNCEMLSINHYGDFEGWDKYLISSRLLDIGLETREKGPMIIDLHCQYQTLLALKDVLPILSKWGIKFVTLKEFAKINSKGDK